MPRNHRLQATGGQRLPKCQGEYPHPARLTHDQALSKAARGSVRDYMQVDKQLVDLVDKEAFRRSVSDLGQR